MRKPDRDGDVEIHLKKALGEERFLTEVEADCGDSFLTAIMELVDKYARSQGISHEMALAILASRMLAQ